MASTARRSFSATSRALPAGVPGSTKANSSPPKRAARSVERSQLAKMVWPHA